MKIENNAKTISDLMVNFSVILYFDELGNPITDAYTASIETGKMESLVPHRQLLVIHIARYFIELLVELGYKCQQQGNQNIPYFSEQFAFYMNNDAYLKTRKTIKI